MKQASDKMLKQLPLGSEIIIKSVSKFVSRNYQDLRSDLLANSRNFVTQCRNIRVFHTVVQFLMDVAP